MKGLTQAQNQVIEIIERRAKGERPKLDCEVTINFHPDRLTANGQPVLIAMAQSGKLSSQFETHTSNGSLTAYHGGKRWQWESRAFDGVYDTCLPIERPKYGALNYRKQVIGASPRFGSAHFRLTPKTLARTTFCYPDSYFKPQHFATYHQAASLIQLAEQPLPEHWEALDNYIEAHIHGDINIEYDVASLVLDPIYSGTEIERQARQLPCELTWHKGFSVSVQVVEQHESYRGKKIVELAKMLAHKGVITPDLIGERCNLGLDDPQDLKKVWHYLVTFGYSL
ncbi:DUF3626 domain-containing protein [uncultured Shewanella sp.]|uniref:DUF3626 domain-containing protein n=1 Tax=uncultured Shewanella sp. TaxID=173975 RepID=UPI00261D6259|nr:DUF3626 domain-containing protein [uncultured Shewanella sp.]